MNQEKMEDCYKLWKECFGDSKNYMDYYFKEKTKDNQILTQYEGTQLVAMVHLNPYHLMFRGQAKEANYIVGVATEMSFRKQGRMKQLLEKSFHNMEEEGQDFTYLMPADERIYRPFGFEYIYSQRRLHLGEIEQREWKIKSGWKNCTIDGIKEQERNHFITYVNQKLENNFTLYAVRDLNYYSRLSKEMQAAGGNVLVFYQDGVLKGVIAYMLENGHMEIPESIIESSETEEILNGLFCEISLEKEVEVTFLESHFLQVDMIKDKFPNTKEEMKPIIMAKILGDLKKSAFEFFKEDKIYLNEIV